MKISKCVSHGYRLELSGTAPDRLEKKYAVLVWTDDPNDDKPTVIGHRDSKLSALYCGKGWVDSEAVIRTYEN